MIFCLLRLACYCHAFLWFLDRNWSHIANHLPVVVLVGVTVFVFKKPKAPSFQIESGWTLGEQSRQRLWRDCSPNVSIDVVGFLISQPCHHFWQKSAAIWWVHTQRLLGANAVASASSWWYNVRNCRNHSCCSVAVRSERVPNWRQSTRYWSGSRTSLAPQ